jgi:PPM family protein phosphatase
MWHRKDSKRHVPADIGRHRGASFHDPAEDRAVRHSPDLHLDGHGASRIGKTRRTNQDQHFVLPLQGDPVNCLLGVADGIGGCPGGTEAARFVADSFQSFVQEESPLLLRLERNDGEILETLNRGLRRCHTVLQAEVERRPEYSGMGTTLTAALVIWPAAYVVHLGDSRAYLLQDGALQRLTRDHTYGQSLLDAGVLTPKTMAESHWKNVVSNFITGKIPEDDPEVHPDVHIVRLHPGDGLLLCTDGLTDVVPDEELARILTRSESAEDLCDTLIGLAVRRGARDDATAVVARFDETRATPGGRRRPRGTT